MRTVRVAAQMGYGPKTTAREVMGDRRLDGAIAVVTGGYVGVGMETTLALAAAGATVIVPARTLTRRARPSRTSRASSWSAWICSSPVDRRVRGAVSSPPAVSCTSW